MYSIDELVAVRFLPAVSFCPLAVSCKASTPSLNKRAWKNLEYSRNRTRIFGFEEFEFQKWPTLAIAHTSWYKTLEKNYLIYDTATVI